MAFEMHSGHYESISNIPTVFLLPFELYSRANTLGMCKNHSMQVCNEFVVFEWYSSEHDRILSNVARIFEIVNSSWFYFIPANSC